VIYVIFGMHKSGTTLVSQILHHSGINMGEDLETGTSYDRGNKYERESTLALNMDILGLNKMTRGASLNLDLSQLRLTENRRARMHEIIQSCNGTYVDWGFKDPRTALVYPFWASELPEHRIIVIYRSPGEIWPRFRDSRWQTVKNPYNAWKFIMGWCKYNAKILSYLENTRMDFLVLSYREFMASDLEFNRLQEFVGQKLNDQREKSLYRSREKSYPLLKMATWLVYQQTGWTPEEIINQFEILRQKQLAVSHIPVTL
jgi:hypothetical protein